jgi:hypothetical protein
MGSKTNKKIKKATNYKSDVCSFLGVNTSRGVEEDSF